MESRRHLIIANPISGSGLARKICTELVRLLTLSGHEVELRWTDGPGRALPMAKQAVLEGWPVIAACGGDGTVHEVLNGLIHSDIGLCVLPAGKGNDLARELGMPTKPKGMAALLEDNFQKSMDVGKIGDRYFGTVATLGFDAEVASLVHEGAMPFSGALTYILATFKTLATYKCQNLTLSGDFGMRKASVFLAATANTASYGGGMKIAPDALLDDGYFDVCLIHEVSKLTVLLILPRVFSGSHVKHPKVEMLRTRNLTIESENELFIFADGEPVAKTPATIEMLPQALKVVVPRP